MDSLFCNGDCIDHFRHFGKLFCWKWKCSYVELLVLAGYSTVPRAVNELSRSFKVLGDC